MGKYTATRAMHRDRNVGNRGGNSFSTTGSYIFDVPTTENQFMTQAFLYNADPTGMYSGALSTRDTMNYWRDYFKNTGLTWSDVKYPTLMMNFGSIGYGRTARTTLNYISRNFARLYR